MRPAHGDGNTYTYYSPQVPGSGEVQNAVGVCGSIVVVPWVSRLHHPDTYGRRKYIYSTLSCTDLPLFCKQIWHTAAGTGSRRWGCVC